MQWWMWVLVWVGVCVVSLVALGLIGYSLWTKLKAIFAELTRLTSLLERLEQAQSTLQGRERSLEERLAEAEQKANRRILYASRARRVHTRRVAIPRGTRRATLDQSGLEDT